MWTYAQPCAAQHPTRMLGNACMYDLLARPSTELRPQQTDIFPEQLADIFAEQLHSADE